MDNGDQAGVQKCAGTAADGIAVGEEGIAQNNRYVLKLREFPYDVSGPQFIGPIVVRGEKLHDTDAVAVCQKGGDSAAQHFPVGFF